MLALTRKKGESLVINNNIEVTILEIRGDQIKLGISAPHFNSSIRRFIGMTVPIGN